MTILDRHIGARLIATFFKVLLSLVFLFILIDLFTNRRNDIARHDVPWSVVLHYYAVFIPTIIYKYQGASLSILVAALLVFGSLAQNNEITATLAGGISLRRIVRVPVLLAALLAVGLFSFQETVGVAANRQVRKLDDRYFSRNSESAWTGMSWARLAGGWTCHIMKFNRISLAGENLFMHQFGQEKAQQIQAGRVYWDPDKNQWTMEDGRWFVFDLTKNWECQVTRVTQLPAPIEESPEELFAMQEPPDTKTVPELMADIRGAEQYGMPVGAYLADLHAKFAQPALCFVMVWLAIPFAMRLRRGGLAIGFGVSIAIALAYLILFRISMGLGHIERMNPVVAAWLANVVFLAYGMIMFRRTPT